MRVARVEPVGDAPARLFEHDALGPLLPPAGEAPLVEVEAVRRRPALAAKGPEIRLGRLQVTPVRLGLDADADDADVLALDAEELLDATLRLLVTPFTEVVVADHSLLVDEVERRPVMVVEGVQIA
jgi:hypothetical protein